MNRKKSKLLGILGMFSPIGEMKLPTHCYREISQPKPYNLKNSQGKINNKNYINQRRNMTRRWRKHSKELMEENLMS